MMKPSTPIRSRRGPSRPVTAATDRRVGSPPYSFTVMHGNGSEMVAHALTSRPWWKEKAEGSAGATNLLWAGNGQKIDWVSFHSAPAGSPLMIVNRAKGNGGITTKDRLCLNLRKYARAAKLDPASLTPLSFVVRAPAEGESDLKADYDLMAFRAAASTAKQRGETMWILKPALLNRGRGIQVFSSPKAVESYLSRGRRPNACYVVQKYIERPLLLSGRKFDIRQFVLLSECCRIGTRAVAACARRERVRISTSAASDGKVYMYRDSCARGRA